MIKHFNKAIGMVMDSTIVYVDGKTIKHPEHNTDYTGEEVRNIMENIDDYYITFFNRDRSNGERVLKLTTKHVL